MSDAELLLLVETRKKSGAIAALLNLFLPGAGYMYCGRWFLGVVAFFFTIALLVFSLGLAVVGVVLMLVIDGFLCAGRYNKQVIEAAMREAAGHKETRKKDPATTSPPAAHAPAAQQSSLEQETPATDGSAGQRTFAPTTPDYPFAAQVRAPRNHRSTAALVAGAVLMAGIGAGAVLLAPGLRERFQAPKISPAALNQPAALPTIAVTSESPQASVEIPAPPQGSPEGPGSPNASLGTAAGADRTGGVEVTEQKIQLLQSNTTSADNSGTRVHAQPNADAEVVAVLPPDTAIWVTDEPYMADGWTQMRLADGGAVLGWVRNDRLHDYRSESQ